MGETTLFNLLFNFRPLSKQELDIVYKNLPQINTTGKTVTLQESAQQVLDWITGKSKTVENANAFNKYFIQYINVAIENQVTFYNSLKIQEYADAKLLDVTDDVVINTINELIYDGTIVIDNQIVYDNFIKNIKYLIAAVAYTLTLNKGNITITFPNKQRLLSISTLSIITNDFNYDSIFEYINKIISDNSTDTDQFIFTFFNAFSTIDIHEKASVTSVNLITYGYLPIESNNIQSDIFEPFINEKYVEKVEK